MLSLHLNLENETGLQTGFDKLFDSLSIEDKKEVAKSALTQYLTNTVDYEKEAFKRKIIDDVRKNGFNGEYRSYDISIEDAEKMTDDVIASREAISKKIREYKTSRESRYDEINKILKDELESTAKEFIKNNGELQSIVETKKQEIIDNFIPMTTNIMSGLVQTLFLEVLRNATIVAPMQTNMLANISQQLNNQPKGY